MNCENCGHKRHIIRTLKHQIKDGKKMCSGCLENKDVSEFDKLNTKTPDKLKSECKECRKIRNKTYYDFKKMKNKIIEEEKTIL